MYHSRSCMFFLYPELVLHETEAALQKTFVTTNPCYRAGQHNFDAAMAATLVFATLVVSHPTVFHILYMFYCTINHKDVYVAGI
jgi:hypothetical protein